MTGTYWSTGITVAPHDPKWGLGLTFFDGLFCDEDSIEGTLACRYLVTDAVQAARTLVAAAADLGISFRDPQVFVHGDAENTNGWPGNWQQAVEEIAAGLGWPAPAFLGANSDSGA